MLVERTLKKHVAIIHAYSLMSSLQRKVVNVLLYEAIKGNNRLNHKESVAVEYRTSFSKLSKSVKFNSNNTKYLKEAIDGLASIKIEWNLLKDKVPSDISFLNLRVLHGSPTFYQDSTLNFSFHKVLLDLVDNPLIYGTIDIDLQSQFESKYSHSLYENSTRLVNLKQNKIIQLDIFRKILGVDENKYSSMREFTRNVIATSLEEVNDRADFIVSLEGIKTGRKVTGFEVSVHTKRKTNKTDKPLNFFKNGNVWNEIKQTFGILSDRVAENILKNYTEEYILEKIAYTKKYVKKDSFGFYPIPYFITALRDDYKVIENSSPQQVQMIEKLSVQEKQWRNVANDLQSDLNHWEKMFGYAIPANNAVQIDNIQKIIKQCEEKLRQHYLAQPIIEPQSV